MDEAVSEPGKISKGLPAKPRLTLRSKDADFFRTYVQTKGAVPALLELSAAGLKTDAQRAVRANAKALHKTLSAWTAGRRLDLVQMLIMRTFLVVVSTPDLNSAHRIFSVMNSRGLDLTPADIFKSQIIGDLGEGDAADVTATKWENAEEALGRDDFGDLFLHLRMIYAKERAKAELLKEFSKQVLEPHFLPGKAQVFVNEVLVPYADAYAQIRDHDYRSETGAERVNVWVPAPGADRQQRLAAVGTLGTPQSRAGPGVARQVLPSPRTPRRQHVHPSRVHHAPGPAIRGAVEGPGRRPGARLTLTPAHPR
ncbi:DUF262 domain-containing protein [Streptomyces sp. H10-C2]|uniref:DUF262 domain-containing protein n=1 Tax=unclassified Streptomyces TaxID=2593676 RepID=UPI0024BAB438|nr:MULTISPECIES: DUF262 domain-containing protein [unclassified Streptomyces]MDJ0345355.1 DUF262 domain-containing protein [Streptomyces sp. PH10-H1]MDJ0374206.1 DUF262 domain-containing protein [Streptomyces sp. H10-C2]